MKAIPYYRVSTDRQGVSGLGLDAQKDSVQQFAKSRSLTLSSEFIEVESSRKKNRPVLENALVACKKEKAVLLIAKLDRLGRDVFFISSLLASGVEFIAVDNPHANKLIVHIMAAFAEHERDLISSRTKDALRIAKSRGVILGAHGRNVLSAANRKNANEFALKMQPVFDQLKKSGHVTLRHLTHELNRLKIKTFSGGTAKWHLHTVHSVIKRLENLNIDSI